MKKEAISKEKKKKEVFSKEKWRLDCIARGYNPTDFLWPYPCEGKTKKEMAEMGIATDPAWMVEVNR